MLKTNETALRWLIALFIGVSIFISGAVWADDITDSIEEAIKYYKGGDYAEVTNSLDFASQLIRQKRAKNLEAFLPEPLAGWSAEDIKTTGNVSGSLISVQRRYRKDQSSVTIEVITDSPSLYSKLKVFSNFAYASADGGRLTLIKKQKAIIKYRPSRKDGEINVVVAKQYLLTIKGREVKETDLVDYASAIDYKKLKKL